MGPGSGSVARNGGVDHLGKDDRAEQYRGAEDRSGQIRQQQQRFVLASQPPRNGMGHEPRKPLEMPRLDVRRGIDTVAHRGAAGVRIDYHVVVREIGHARLQAGERRRGLAGAPRPAQQNAVIAPSHQTGVQRLKSAVAVPEKQLGMEGTADVVLGEAVGVADPAYDALRLPVEPGLDLREGGDDKDAIRGDVGDPGGRGVVVGDAPGASDSGLRFVPEIDRELTGCRGPIGDPEMGQGPGDEPGQPAADDAQPGGLSREIIARFEDIPGRFLDGPCECRRKLPVHQGGRIDRSGDWHAGYASGSRLPSTGIGGSRARRSAISVYLFSAGAMNGCRAAPDTGIGSTTGFPTPSAGTTSPSRSSWSVKSSTCCSN